MTTSSGRSTGKKKEVLSIAFVKKYIQYAKNRIHPVLTKGAADYIVGVYAALRNDDLASNQKRVSTGRRIRQNATITAADSIAPLQTSPLTARTLETLIRLSTAHAKSRLSAKVDERDAMAAEEILRFALFKEVLKPERRKKRKLNTGKSKRSDRSGSDDSDDEDEIDGGLVDGEGEDDDDDVVNGRTETRDERAAARSKRMVTPRESVPRSVQEGDMDVEAEEAMRDMEQNGGNGADAASSSRPARGPDTIEPER